MTPLYQNPRYVKAALTVLSLGLVLALAPREDYTMNNKGYPLTTVGMVLLVAVPAATLLLSTLLYRLLGERHDRWVERTAAERKAKEGPKWWEK